MNGQRRKVFGHWVNAIAVGDSGSTWHYMGTWGQGDFRKERFDSAEEVFKHFEVCQMNGTRP